MLGEGIRDNTFISGKQLFDDQNFLATIFVKLLSRKKGSALVKSFIFRFTQQELGSAFTSVAAPGYNKG